MRVEDSKYTEKDYKKVFLFFGNFYLFEKFVVSELNEGIHYSWEYVEQLISEMHNHYGTGFKIGYVSNRVNLYSIEPQNWLKFEREHDFIKFSAVVLYSEDEYQKVIIEKIYSKNKVKRCKSLYEAINWITSQK